MINPSRIILIEAEVWPNLVAEAHGRGVPLVLANARLSARSERRFRRFRFVVAPIFQLLDLVCVPEAEDVTRWSAIGVRYDRIRCTGSIKYDAQGGDIERVESEKLLAQVSIANRPVLLGGSTHAGEEELLGQTLLGLRLEFPSLLLIIAPRHVERTAEIRRALERLGLKVALQSGEKIANADCVLLDSTGELQKWYTTATVVFIGKSLVAHGGQNPVEAIIAGAPVIFGPHMENFAGLAGSLIQAGGAIEIRSAADLKDSAARLLRNSESRSQHVRSAREVLKAHSGAGARTAKLVVDFASAH